MEDRITIESNGKTYLAEYLIIDDTLTVYLPDGSVVETELRGLNPETAAKVHLKSYIKKST